MNISKLLTPRTGRQSILLLLFAYLAVITVLMIIAADPFKSVAANGFKADTKIVSAAHHIEVDDAPIIEVGIPEPPYIVIEPIRLR
ncbi:MAG: hypothetical protein H8E48_06170 [Chloroflexi bacterium]|nr:hypothetical protein [Chloroflexota bacterium]